MGDKGDACLKETGGGTLPMLLKMPKYRRFSGLAAHKKRPLEKGPWYEC